MIHQLKIKENYFKQILEGTKTFEVRINDRNYHVGDFLGLNEIVEEDDSVKETGRCTLVKVLGVLSDEAYIKEGFVIISFRPCIIEELVGGPIPCYCNNTTVIDIPFK